MEIKWFMAHWTSSFKYTARCCGMCMCILPITTTHHLHASIPTRISRLATDHTTRTLAFQTPTRQRPKGGGEKRPGVNWCSTKATRLHLQNWVSSPTKYTIARSTVPIPLYPQRSTTTIPWPQRQGTLPDKKTSRPRQVIQGLVNEAAGRIHMFVPSSLVSTKPSFLNHSSPMQRPAVESAVTRLLVSIKLLLEALSLWSTQRVTETDVSDVYVRLGNDFNAAVAAFGQFGIEMKYVLSCAVACCCLTPTLSELLSVPDDLRNELEQCLSEDATPSNLEVYLPRIREIITDLLQGLRNKQTLFKEMEKHRWENERRTRSSRTESRVSRAESDSSRLSRSQHVRPNVMSDDGSNRSSAEVTPGRRVVSARHAHSGSTSSRPSSRTDDRPPQPPPPPPPLPTDKPPVDVDTPNPQANQKRSSKKRLGGVTAVTKPVEPEVEIPRPISIQDERVSPEVKRYSLVDNPMPQAPAVVVAEPTPPNSEDNIAAISAESPNSGPPSATPETPPIAPIDDSQAPVMESSLAALKGSDLGRRASKRFSTYNISKITGGGIKERMGFGRNNRRSMAVDSSNLTPGELDVLTEVEEPGSSPSLKRSDSGRSKPHGINGSMSRKGIDEDPSIPPVPEVPKDIGRFAIATNEKKDIVVPQVQDTPTSANVASSSTQITVFLQVGREVKKASIEPGQSFASLRVLFMDKFSYNPGKDNFPSIYIRDPSSGVQYELEDVDEVKDKCLLSLNIERKSVFLSVIMLLLIPSPISLGPNQTTY